MMTRPETSPSGHLDIDWRRITVAVGGWDLLVALALVIFALVAFGGLGKVVALLVVLAYAYRRLRHYLDFRGGLRTMIEQVLGAPPTSLRVTRQHGRTVAVSFTYPPSVRAWEERRQERLDDALSARFGVPWNATWLTHEQKVTAVPLDPRLRRAVQAVREAFGEGSVIHHATFDQRERVDTLSLQYPSSFRGHASDVQAGALDQLAAMLGDRWEADWRTTRDRVELRRVPLLPRFVRPVLEEDA